MQGLDNQDIICENESKTAYIIVVADGVSSCANGKRGAEIACKAICDIMLDETEYIFSASKKKIAGLLSSYVYKKLNLVANEDNQPITSYSSTLSFVCYNKIDGKIMTFVLGDSLVYLISEGRLALACKPILFYDSKTYTTTTESIAEIIDLNIFFPQKNARYLLATDGAWKTFYSDGMLSSELECAVKEEKIIDYLKARHCVDDCSIAIIDLPKGV